MVLTKQLSEIIADYRARMHCARFSKNKAVEAENPKNRIELADEYRNKHYKYKYNDLLEDILYTHIAKHTFYRKAFAARKNGSHGIHNTRKKLP
jgi:hypothetical protein